MRQAKLLVCPRCGKRGVQYRYGLLLRECEDDSVSATCRYCKWHCSILDPMVFDGEYTTEELDLQNANPDVPLPYGDRRDKMKDSGLNRFVLVCPWCRQRSLALYVTWPFGHRFVCRDNRCDFLAKTGKDADDRFTVGTIEGVNPALDTNGGLGWGEHDIHNYFHYMILEEEEEKERREAWERSRE